jgi:hypothetical protein
MWGISLIAFLGLLGIIASLNQLLALQRLDSKYTSAEALILIKLTIPCSDSNQTCYSYKIRYGNGVETKYTNESTLNHEVGERMMVYFQSAQDTYFEVEKPVHDKYSKIILPVLSIGSCFVVLGITSFAIRIFLYVQSKKTKKGTAK